MLLDEPFSGLDARLRDEVRATTIAVLRSTGVATLMVTHDPHEAMTVADKISIIHAGSIEQSGTPRKLYEFPVSKRVATALGEASCFTGEVQSGRLETPFGTVEAPFLADGDRATVILRPESLALVAEASPSSVRAVVRSARYLGGSVRIEAELPCGRPVIAIAPSSCALRCGETVHVALTGAGGGRVVRAP